MKNAFFRNLVLVALASYATGASADMGLKEMQKADALAKIITSAGTCGYAIDDGKLETYYAKHGLDDPQVLSYLGTLIENAKHDDQPSQTECTLIRSTAKKMGVLVS